MNYSGAEGLEFGGGNTLLDPAVLAVLPHGCQVSCTEEHGVSFWANTGRIDVQLENGGSMSFFIKVISGDVGKNMTQSEFESMNSIYKLQPDFVPKPIAHGTYATIPDTHFFLCEFREMSETMPDPHKFCARLAALHQSSESPTGKFGYHITTYSGNLPQMTEWEASWEAFFTRNLRFALDLEIATRGPDPEFDTLLPVLFDTVIPRLLRPLESEGRSVKPSLVHGDLWYANSGIDESTGESLIFDACCFYAHNEYEFGQWRPVCNRFGAEYLNAYHDYIQISAPEEDYDGRLDLYKLRFNTHVSALFSENQALREQMLGDIRDLVRRYGNLEPGDAGYTGYKP
ncbi:Fructosamine kinase-domain-containing protein [Xylaria sp. FL0064]|nr:Fructosamine kinase-domain-containing protein [Xylaria sp. FL0064]